MARTSEEPELVASIAAVSAAYLGATPWADLAAVGTVHGAPDAVGRADNLFRSHPTPWCGTHF